MRWLVLAVYRLVVAVYYGAALATATLFNNRKAQQWVQGRKHTQRLLSSLSTNKPVIWMHCASLGEYEQGRPILEQLKQQHGHTHYFVLTFFSPSGYEVVNNKTVADLTAYLPLDTPARMHRWYKVVQPQVAVFIKYEYWYYAWTLAPRYGCRLVLASALFQQGNPVFSPLLGGFYRYLLSYADQLFVQDTASLKRLQQAGLKQASVAGDTRFDRVKAVAEEAFSDATIETFCSGNSKVFIAGSTWPDDHRLFEKVVNAPESREWKFIIVPHDINTQEIDRFMSTLQVRAARYTDEQADLSAARVLVVDKMGMLSRLYRYGSAAYIGGGFNSGIHNVLEAAAYGLVTFFGPNYSKAREAVELVEQQLAFTVSNAAELQHHLNEMATNTKAHQQRTAAIHQYINSNQGATATVTTYVNGLLSSR